MKKKIVGIQVRGTKEYCHNKGGEPNASVQRVYEVLRAEKEDITIRVTEDGTWAGISDDGMIQIAPGVVVWEAEYSPGGTRLRRNGVVLSKKDAEGRAETLYQDCMCEVLWEAFQDDFTGYEHNYTYLQGEAHEEEEDER